MEKRKIKIGLETAQRWYGSNDEELKQLAVQTWPEVVGGELPERWEDLGKISGHFVGRGSDIFVVKPIKSSIENKSIFATKEQAEAALALAQLTQLASVWCDKDGMWGIYLDVDKRVISLLLSNDGGWEYILRFETKEKCNRFIDFFEDLILKASALTL